MAENAFGSPGVGLFQKQYNSILGEKEGFVFIRVTDDIGFTNDLVFIVQSYQLQKAERVQEVRTLADTAHLYTFGKELPRLMLEGMFINSILSPQGHVQFLDHRSNFSTSETILDIWDQSMRAKTVAVGVEGLAQFPIEVDLTSLGRTFSGVGVGLNLSNNISMEAMIPASFTLIIMSEESL